MIEERPYIDAYVVWGDDITGTEYTARFSFYDVTHAQAASKAAAIMRRERIRHVLTYDAPGRRWLAGDPEVTEA